VLSGGRQQDTGAPGSRRAIDARWSGLTNENNPPYHPAYDLLTSTFHRVETMGLEPTTSCLQITGWTVCERPQGSPADIFDAHALTQSTAVATAGAV
jgi:hypothetical protein